MLSNKDTVNFLIGGQDLSENLKSFTLHYDMFSGAASFDAELDVRLDIRLSEAIRNFVWKINGVSVMTGYLDRIDRSYAKGSSSVRVSGRDMVQVLLDNFVMTYRTYVNVGIKTLIYDNIFVPSMTIKTISDTVGSVAKTLEKPLSLVPLNFKYTTAAEQKIKSFQYRSIKTNPGETLFESIHKICDQIGLFMYNLPGTSTIMIHAINPSEGGILTGYDSNGNPTTDQYTITTDKVISCEFSEDIQDFHKFIRVIGNAQEEEALAKAVDKILYTTEQPLKIEKIESVPSGQKTIKAADLNLGFRGLPKFMVTEVSDIDVNTWSTHSVDLVNNVLTQQKRRLFSHRYKVANFSPDNSQTPYFFNRMASVTDEFLGYNNTILQVTGVEFRGSKDEGFTTELTMALPSTSAINVRGSVQ